jgi:multidrug transporter EmrE-like cation transporter
VLLTPSEGFTGLLPNLGVVVRSVINVFCCSRPLKRLPVGTAYTPGPVSAPSRVVVGMALSVTRGSLCSTAMSSSSCH